MARRKQPVIPDQLLDQLLAGTDAKMAFEKDGLLDELKKALAERVLNAEMDHHLDAGAADGRVNSRNGYGRKTLLTDSGKSYFGLNEIVLTMENQKAAEPGDLPPSESEEESDDDMPANPNHTAKARNQAAKAPAAVEAPAAKDKGKGKQDVSQLSRREREALQAQANKDRYDKLHAEGKTEQARADLERLKLVRERRDAEAARKKAEAEERAELEKEKKELMERENRRREQAKGKAERLAKGGKKKA